MGELYGVHSVYAVRKWDGLWPKKKTGLVAILVAWGGLLLLLLSSLRCHRASLFSLDNPTIPEEGHLTVIRHCKSTEILSLVCTILFDNISISSSDSPGLYLMLIGRTLASTRVSVNFSWEVSYIRPNVTVLLNIITWNQGQKKCYIYIPKMW